MEAALWNSDGQECWSLPIPLAGEDYLNFTRVANLDDASLKVGALVAVFRKTLSRPPVPDAVAYDLSGLIEHSISG